MCSFQDGFADNGADGGVIDVVIYIEETDQVYNARIKRILSGIRGDMFMCQLFVDGYLIMEHTKESQMGGYYPQEPPPPYPGNEGCAFPDMEAKKDV